MTKERMQLIIFLCVVILVIGLLSVWAISHFSKLNLKYKFVESQRITNEVIKLMGTEDDPRIYAGFIRKEKTFRDAFLSTGILNIDDKMPPLREEEYKITYKNKSKNSEINPTILGDFNITTKNNITYFIKDYERVIYIAMDINGYRSKPNVLGEDLFVFQMLNNGKIYPMGSEFTDFSKKKYTDLCSKDSYSGFNGITCTDIAVEALKKNESYFNF